LTSSINGTNRLPTNDIEVDSIPETVCNKCLTFLVGWLWWGISQAFFCAIILLFGKSLNDFFQTSTPAYLAAFGSIGAFVIAFKTNFLPKNIQGGWNYLRRYFMRNNGPRYIRTDVNNENDNIPEAAEAEENLNHMVSL
jgi:hypothetical protein